MAFAGFTHTGTPGGANGLGPDIRSTMAGDVGFNVNFTVHPVVTIGSDTFEASYWVVEHTSGIQILFGVAHGTNADVVFAERSIVFGTSNYNMWIALDPIGGGTGTDSFYDNLYNNGLDPESGSFWNQAKRSKGVRVVEWYGSSSSTTLWFVYDSELGHLIIFSNGNASGRANSISVAAASNLLIDDTKIAEDDRMPSRAGVIAVQADTDSGGNDVTDFTLYTFPDGKVYDDTDERSGDIPEHFYLFDNDTWAPEPDAQGLYMTQTIPVRATFGNDTVDGDQIVGEIDRAIARFNPRSNIPLGKRRAGGTLINGQQEMMWGWADSLGDIIP